MPRLLLRTYQSARRKTRTYLRRAIYYFSAAALGERAATRYYRALPALIISRNWRDRWGEIDLVVQLERKIVFVEVKTRRSDLSGDFSGESAYDDHKQQRIEAASRRFINLNRALLVRHRICKVAFELITVQYATFYGLRFVKNLARYRSNTSLLWPPAQYQNIVTPTPFASERRMN